MDAYPPELVAHETPLLLVSGLGSPERWADADSSDAYSYPQLLQNGSRVTSAVVPVTTPAGELLLDYFLKNNSSGIWAGRTTERLKTQTPAWRVRPVGRNYILPPRKANPPPDERFTSSLEGPPTRIQALHSPVSPLSPESSLYPDGVLSHLWLRKHQLLVPAAFAATYELYTASNDLPTQNLKDNELIAAINSQKKFFSPNSNSTSNISLSGDDIRSSGHRSKFVVILLSDKSILSSPRIDERLSYIKRSTNLVPNVTFFFLPAHSSPVEVQHFVATLLTTLYPSAIEYYRELSKHSRRKRNKGSIPPPTVPSSRALSLQAWNLRFEFKLGLFAEFRQEMDVAARNYETAYEKLLTEVFETTTSWSDRWTEARLLADIISLRIIRCHLWNEQYVTAKRRWSYHIAQMSNVLDRKGHGTDTYGFAAWMSRWNCCLAEFLHAANLPVFTPISAPPSRSPMLAPDVFQEPQTIYAPAEKSINVSDRLSPLDYLHHPGFYYLRAAEYTSVRARRAEHIALDDAESTHDVYLCPLPAEEATVDHGAVQISLLVLARREFEMRQQRRMADGITYQLAKLKMAAAATRGKTEYWGEALKELRNMAGVYRKEGWWEVLEDVLWSIVECGRNNGDGGSVVVAGLELLCKEVFKERGGWKYDLGRCLEGVEAVKVRPTMVVRGGDVVSFLTASYTFETPKVHVGDSVISQLVISSSAQPSSTPIVFTELKINYEGSLKTVLLRHDPSSTPPSSKTTKLDLKGKIHEQQHSYDEPLPSPTSIKSFLVANTDLSLAPGETKIYELSSILREAGEAKAICATFVFVSEGFELDFMIMLDAEDEESSVHILPGDVVRTGQLTANGGNGVWWTEVLKKGEEGVVELKKKPLRALEPGSVEILPRPPKMDVTARSAVVGDIYVNEIVRIEFEATNGEDEEAVVDVGVKILGWPDDEPPHITWLQENGVEELPTASLYPLGKLPASESAKRTFTFPSPAIPADCAIEITVHYHLVSDPETPIAKPVTADMPVINPFRTSFDFSPRVHPEKWPDYFSLSEQDIAPGKDGKEPALGIKQRWCLTVGIVGMGEGVIEIEGWELPVLGMAGGVLAEVVETGNDGNTLLQQGGATEILFIIDVHKLSLEDRRAASVDVNLDLKWRRRDIGPEWLVIVNTTSLPVPRLPIPGSEPRVLAVVVTPPAPQVPQVVVAPPPVSPPENTLTLTRARTTSTVSLIPTPAVSNIAIPGILHLEYTLENPTNYFLTFNVVMEANEEFAFSGPKQTSLQLLPVSRVTLRYRIFTYKIDEAAKQGSGKSGGVEWAPGTKGGEEAGGVAVVKQEGGLWIRPGLKVVDRYFNKTLRVSPGSEGVAVDKAGLMVWVPCEEGRKEV